MSWQSKMRAQDQDRTPMNEAVLQPTDLKMHLQLIVLVQQSKYINYVMPTLILHLFYRFNSCDPVRRL